MFTMGDIARQSHLNEELLYRLFGVNAELLIDHAWGWEPCTIAMVKSYRPESNSFSYGQVLHEPYSVAKARIVIREMAENAALDLLDKKMVTDQLVLTVGYDVSSLSDPAVKAAYKGSITLDYYGRPVPKHAHGSVSLERQTSSASIIADAAVGLYDRIMDQRLLVRRMNLTTNHVVTEEEASRHPSAAVQYDLFSDMDEVEKEMERESERLDKERRMQSAVLKIKKQFGKNAILKGLNFEEGATMKDRNRQIGGHKA